MINQIKQFVIGACLLISVVAGVSPPPAYADNLKAQQVEFLLSQVRNTTGSLVSGTVTFYAAGTTTLKTVWSDRDKATPAANPYTLDANGTAQLYADGLYKVLIKNAAGTTVYTRDNLQFTPDATNNDYYADPTAADQGATTNSRSIASLLAAIGTSKQATIVLAHSGSGNTTTYTIGQNVNWSAYTNVTFKIVPGAKFSGAFTLNIPNVDAMLYQIFDSTLGTVTLSGAINEAYPEWWGIDGTADDVQISLAAAAHRRVKLQKTTYNYSSRIAVSVNGTQIIGSGYGTRLLQASGTPVAAFYVTASYASIENLRVSALDAAGAANTFDGSAIVVYQATETKVTNIQIDSARGGGVLLADCIDCKVTKCRITGISTGGQAIGVITFASSSNNSSGNIVSENTIQGLGAGTTGINVQNQSTTYETIQTLVTNNVTAGGTGGTGHGITVYSSNTGMIIRYTTIANNIIRGAEGMGIYVAGNTTTSDVYHTIVSGNQVISASSVGSGGTLVNAAIGIDWALYTDVKGNVVKGGGSASASAIRTRNSSYTNIEGNILSDLGSFPYGGIVCNSNYSTITNNYVSGAGHANYRISSGTIVTVSGNFSENSVGQPGYLVESTTDAVLSGNTSRNDGVNGIQVDVTSSRTRLLHNKISAPATGSSIVDNASGTERYGNKVSTTGLSEGTAILVGGTVTVSTIETTNNKITLTRVLTGGTPGHLTVGTVVAGTSFVIDSTSATDTSTIFWEIHH